jgi:hypothetical protein
MQASRQQWYDVNTALVANETPAYLKRFPVQFEDQGVQYSTCAIRHPIWTTRSSFSFPLELKAPRPLNLPEALHGEEIK